MYISISTHLLPFGGVETHEYLLRYSPTCSCTEVSRLRRDFSIRRSGPPRSSENTSTAQKRLEQNCEVRMLTRLISVQTSATQTGQGTKLNVYRILMKRNFVVIWS